jgi:hypothetical protein
MAEKKITKREKFEMLLGMVEGNEMLTEFINHEIELLSRKGSKSAKLTPAQEDAYKVGELIRNVLSVCSDPKGMTVGALLKEPTIASYTKHDGNGVSSQMITAILSKTTVSESCPEGDFIRTVEKKTAYYALNYGVKGEEVGE